MKSSTKNLANLQLPQTLKDRSINAFPLQLLTMPRFQECHSMQRCGKVSCRCRQCKCWGFRRSGTECRVNVLLDALFIIVIIVLASNWDFPSRLAKNGQNWTVSERLVNFTNCLHAYKSRLFFVLVHIGILTYCVFSSKYVLLIHGWGEID